MRSSDLIAPKSHLRHLILTLLCAVLTAAGCGSEEPSSGEVTILSFTLDPASLPAPGEVTIDWRTSNASSVQLSQGSESVDLDDAEASEGSIRIFVGESSTFTLVATGANGQTATTARSIVVGSETAPVIGALTLPGWVEANETGTALVAIEWSGVSGADELVLEIEPGTPRSLDPALDHGGVDVEIQQDTSFTLIARNEAGEEIRESGVVRLVHLPTIESFRSDRGRVGSGEEVEFEWATSGVVQVELWLNGDRLEELDPLRVSGTFTTTIQFDSTVELHATNEAGTTAKALLEIGVGAPAILQFALAPSLWLGDSLALSWETAGGSELRITLDETGEILCEAAGYAEVAGSGCEWQPLLRGHHPLTLTTLNSSGVATEGRVVFAGEGPLIEDFQAAPNALTAGDDLQLSWRVHPDPAGNVPALTLQDDQGNTYAAALAEDTITVTLNRPAAYSFTLAATTDDPRSLPQQAQTAAVVVHPRPTVNLDASPTYFDDSQDEEVVLRWTTTDAATLVLYRLVEGEPVQLLEVPTSEQGAGSHSLLPREDSTFRLVATNSVGASVFADVQVEVAPTQVLSFTADPTSFTQGQQITIRWEARMADELHLNLMGRTYLLEETMAPYLDLELQGGSRLSLTAACGASIEEDGCATLLFPDGFRFPFGGESNDRATIYTNGYIAMDLPEDGASISANQAFPTNADAAHVHLAPFWDRLAWDPLRFPAGNIFYALEDQGEARALIIQWKDVGYGTNAQTRRASFNFQVVLWEDGTFEYRYGRNEARDSDLSSQILSGTSATIGFQLPDQGDSDMIVHNGSLPTLGPPAQRSFAYRPLDAPLGRAGELVLRPYASQTPLVATLTASRDGISHSQSLSFDVSRKPTIELSAQIPPAGIGEEFPLGWSSFNANALIVVDEGGTVRCTASSQAMVEAGICPLTEEAEGSYRYTIRATGDHGVVSELEVLVQVYGGFGIVHFTPDNTSTEKGGAVLLRWETFRAASVAIFAEGVEIMPDTAMPAGSFRVENLQSRTEFTLRATNAVGVIAEQRVVVEIWDVSIGLTASATSVRPGEPITITVDAETLDGGLPINVFGDLPMIEERDISYRYTDIAWKQESTQHTINQAQTSTIVNVDLPSGFSFPYMGETFSSLRVYVDGYISFNMTAPVTASNDPFPTTAAPNVHLAPFWDDLHPRNVGSIWTQAPDLDTFIIQWTQMSMNSGSTNALPHNLNFQLVLHRDGSFEYRYGTMAPHPTGTQALCYPNTCINEVNGASATIGYQWGSGARGHTFHFGGKNNSPATTPVWGGLQNRTLRYPAIQGTSTFTFHPNHSTTYQFCAVSAGSPVCKPLAVDVDFGFSSVTTSKDELSFGEKVTLSWRSEGGTTLNILDGETVVFTTTSLAEIDNGSVQLEPDHSKLYTVELLAGDRREAITRYIDVQRMTLRSTFTASSGPGEEVTLSWTFSDPNPSHPSIIAAPMEEVTGASFHELDISNDPSAEIIGLQSDNVDVEHILDDFSFPYFGTNYSNVMVATDGYLGWQRAASAPLNQPIPNPLAAAIGKSIVPFWDDLHTRAAGRVYAKKFDANRYVIQWSRMSLRWGSIDTSEGEIDFMVVLHRDGSFEFRYGEMIPSPGTPGGTDCYPHTCVNETNGSSATIGYQNREGTAGHLLHFGGTDRAPEQLPIAGGLSGRTWKFTPFAGSGSVKVHPGQTTSYKVCAYNTGTTETVCAAEAEVEVPWGIDLFEATPQAPLAGQPVTLSWSVVGIDSMRVLANGAELASYYAPTIPLLGSLTDTPSGATSYILEVSSLGRIAREELEVQHRTFDLGVTGPSGIYFPGESVVVSWDATAIGAADIAMLTPMGEIDAGPGQPGAFIDVSAITGATQVEISNTNGFGTVAIPFPFPYLGTVQNSLEVFVDGYISFAGFGGTSNGANKFLPASAAADARVHLAPFWDDLILRGGETVWSHAPDPNTLIVQWKGFSRIEGSTASTRYDLNFQVVLRSDGRFEFRYGDMKPPPPPFSNSLCNPSSCLMEADFGTSATVGYQTVDASYGSTLHNGAVAVPVARGQGATDGFLPFPGGLSHRSFGYSPSRTGSARIVVGRSGEQEVCGISGAFVECKSIHIEAVGNSGELAFTELMIDPATGAAAQWLEVRNLSRRTIDLEGFELRSSSGSHRIAGSLPIPAGGLLTFASSNLVGFTPDYVYGSELVLDRLLDTLELLAGDSPINTVSWGIGWQIPRNRTLSLDTSAHLTGVQENSKPEPWCLGTAAGSPGALGESCIHAKYEVDPLSPRPFIDIFATGTRLYEVEGHHRIARLPSTGFKALFFGETHPRIWVSSNGMISFADTVPTQNTAVLPATLPRALTHAMQGPLIAGFWNELQCDRLQFDCRVHFQRMTVDEEDLLVLQWSDFRIGTQGSVTFQIQLWANGDVVVAFADVDHPYPFASPEWFKYQGQEAWIGLEAADRTDILTGHFKRALGLDHRVFHFRAR